MQQALIDSDLEKMNPKLLLTPWYLQPLGSHVLNKSI